ncbi:cyclin-H1-1 isoform X2 [Vigna angularis]|uniref:cyclin-H1-1 isoform X2 n=1 Tax=Phaseolus angularis TaxID=3914 RepID=UPI0022B3F73D|nr:cyclin-H1-1 isoform X2 [Vigna angularis]
MADFMTSTHRVKWIFTPQQLVEKYKAANQRAKHILEKVRSILGQNLLVLKKNNAYGYFMKTSYKKYVTTSASLIRSRLTCIYAACKIEENHVSAEELGKGISQDHQMILINEMIVYQSLEFDLIVYAPYRSVEGFIIDMEEFCNGGDDQLQMLKTLQDTARLEVDKMMLTDATLLFPPGQLALAALGNSNALHNVIDFDSYLESIFQGQNSMHTMAELAESLHAIDSCVKKYKIPSEKELKHINRKLKSCWGHSSHDEGKKREKKSKHKSKRSSNEAQNMASLA